MRSLASTTKMDVKLNFFKYIKQTVGLLSNNETSVVRTCKTGYYLQIIKLKTNERKKETCSHYPVASLHSSALMQLILRVTYRTFVK